ncbi:hypothetical protein L9F63_014322, partial [Diploptera punctata]
NCVTAEINGEFSSYSYTGGSYKIFVITDRNRELHVHYFFIFNISIGYPRNDSCSFRLIK